MRINRVLWASPFDELRRQMDRLLEDFGGNHPRSPLAFGAAYPALNIWDAGEALCVEAEIPGVDKDDLEVYAIGNELRIKGRRVSKCDGKVTYHRQERVNGEFVRAVTLPTEVNADKVEAVLKDGVLSVRLPKAEQARPRKIELKTN